MIDDTSPAPSVPPTAADIDRLVTLFSTGRHVELEALLHSLLSRQPDTGLYWSMLGMSFAQQNKDALPALQRAAALLPDDSAVHNDLGCALQQRGQFEEARLSHARAIEIRPDFALAHYNLAHALRRLGRFDEAITGYRRALAIRPEYLEAHNNLGNALREAGRIDDAVTSYTNALKFKPDYAEAHNNLGTAQRDLGQFKEAAESCRRALAGRPDFAAAHNNLGVALQDLGRLDEAMTSLNQALATQPDYAEAHNNLGRTLHLLDRPLEAIASYRQALLIQPDLVDAMNNLALQLVAAGRPLEAVNAASQSLRNKETSRARKIFVSCLRRLPPAQADAAVRACLVRALSEAWVPPSELAALSVDHIRLDPVIEGCIARAVIAWPLRLPAQQLFGIDGLAAVAREALLRTLLDATPVPSIALERFLTMARHALLEECSGTALFDADPALSFHAALARQCFLNEYLFSHTEEEIQRAGRLRDALLAALEENSPIPEPMLLAVAAYFPLHSLAQATRLLDQPWSTEVMLVLDQQLREPLAEARLRDSIPRLTAIANATSLLVQDQYEENPFPRWVRMEPADEAQNILLYLRRKFPLAAIRHDGPLAAPDVLIAGCGTGQHSIGSARHIKGARLLAVDLSLTSLCYARRKSQELGMNEIEYAQADLLELKALRREFDVIESCGVLHHLADPLAGWLALLTLLRPGGVMRLGFYSAVARRDITRIRDFIATRGYGTTADEIRRCRQDLMASETYADFGTTLESPDFFSLSNCRDLLFHVQEHGMTLTGIDAFLRANNLLLLGLDVGSEVIHAYQRRFPNDPAATRLDQWQVFENEHPDTFIGMYQFWIQKTA